MQAEVISSRRPAAGDETCLSVRRLPPGYRQVGWFKLAVCRLESCHDAIGATDDIAREPECQGSAMLPDRTPAPGV